MQDAIRVRRGGVADAAKVIEFNRQLAWETEHLALDPATLDAGVRAVLADSRLGEYWLAEGGGEVVGQCSVTYEWSDWRNGVFWWMQSVYVASAWRRRGVFQALMEEVRREAQAAGAIGLRLYVERENGVAQAVYRRQGFMETPYRLFERALGGE
jgi:ribosomal protein S18 acetylase RimI-like enzyme